jgi:hypothetical protein
MVIRKVNGNTFDVFMSNQYWEDWTRVRIGSPNGVFGVAGRRLSNKVLREIADAINGA